MSSDQEFGAKPLIEIDGVELVPAVVPLLEEVVVDDHLHLPDMFLLRFRDEGKDVIEQASMRIGSKVTVSATAVGDGQQDPLVIGEVTAFEAEYDKTGSHTLVRGYDLSHRLCRTSRTRAFIDMTDADIARQVATDAGLEIGHVEATSTVHEQVSQVRMTDWAFLKQRAESIGYEVAVVLGRFEFRRRTPAEEAPDDGGIEPRESRQLSVGANLEWFRPRVTAAEQVDGAKVFGWDPDTKQVLRGEAPAVTDSCIVGVSPPELARTFDAAEVIGPPRPRPTQAEVDVAVAALSERVSSVHAEAEGIAQGDPALRAGTAVSVALAGFPYDGRYTLTGTRHVYDVGGYRTHLQISGRQDRSLFALSGGQQNELEGRRYYGVYPAQVTNNQDPLGQGRVQLMVPDLGPDFQTRWARRAEIGAGAKRGSQWIPEVGDEVLVSFHGGDPDFPYVLGGLHNGMDEVPLGEPTRSGEVNERGWVSRMGHRILFSDDDADSGITLQTADGSVVVTMGQANKVVRVGSDGTVEISGVGDVTISSDADLTVSAGANLTLEAGGNVSVKGGAAVTVSGTTIALN